MDWGHLEQEEEEEYPSEVPRPSCELGNLTRSTLTWDWSELADDGEER